MPLRLILEYLPKPDSLNSSPRQKEQRDNAAALRRSLRDGRSRRWGFAVPAERVHRRAHRHLHLLLLRELRLQSSSVEHRTKRINFRKRELKRLKDDCLNDSERRLTPLAAPPQASTVAWSTFPFPSSTAQRFFAPPPPSLRSVRLGVKRRENVAALAE